MNKKLIIAFSGIDGGGKSTQINRFVELVEISGSRPRVFWSRGGYTPGFNLAKKGYRKLRGSRAAPSGKSKQRDNAFKSPIVRKIWLSIAIVDMMFLYAIVLRFFKLRGFVVICDRYWQDTAIDFKLNFPQEDVQQWWLWKLLVFMTPLPDAAFLLLVPVEESIARSKLKNEPFPDSPEVLRGRLELYEAMATKNYWNVLDGRREISSLSDEIISIVKSVGRK